MRKYEFLGHTADFRIRVYGRNFKEIIQNSLLALKSFWKPKLTKEKEEIFLDLENKNPAFLLIDFLSEVLSQTYIKKAIFLNFNEEELSLNKIKGKLNGFRFTLLKKDIKAITYHQANFYENKGLFIFEFIIDI